jgi:hypothetical protein
MKPEIVKTISQEIALEFLNNLVEIHNLLIKEDQREAFFRLGALVEQMAERLR